MLASEYLELVDFKLPEREGIDTSVLKHKREVIDPILNDRYKIILGRITNLIRALKATDKDDSARATSSGNVAADNDAMIEERIERFVYAMCCIDPIGMYGTEKGLYLMDILHEELQLYLSHMGVKGCFEQLAVDEEELSYAKPRTGQKAKRGAAVSSKSAAAVRSLAITSNRVVELGKSLDQMMLSCFALMQELHGSSFEYHYQFARYRYACHDHVAALFALRRAQLSYDNVEELLGDAYARNDGIPYTQNAITEHRSFWFGNHIVDGPTQLRANQDLFSKCQHAIGNYCFNDSSFEDQVQQRIVDPLVALAMRFDNSSQAPVSSKQHNIRNGKMPVHYELFTPKLMNHAYRVRFSHSDEYFNESTASAFMDEELTNIIGSVVPGLAARFDFEDNGLSKSLNERNIIITLFLPRRATSLIRYFHRLQLLARGPSNEEKLNVMRLPFGDDDTDNMALRLYAAYADNGLIRCRSNDVAHYAYNTLVKRYANPLEMECGRLFLTGYTKDDVLANAHSHISNSRGYTLKQLAKAPLLLLLARRLAQTLNNCHKRFFTVKVDIDSFKGALQERAKVNFSEYYDISSELYSYLAEDAAAALQIHNSNTDSVTRDDLFGLELELLDNCRECSYLRSAYAHTLRDTDSQHRATVASTVSKPHTSKSKAAKVDIGAAAAAALGLSGNVAHASEAASTTSSAEASPASSGVFGTSAPHNTVSASETSCRANGDVDLFDDQQCQEAFVATRSSYKSTRMGWVKFAPQLTLMPDLNSCEHVGPLLASCAYQAGAPLYYIAIDQKSLRAMDCYRKSKQVQQSKSDEFDLAYTKVSNASDSTAPYSFIKADAPQVVAHKRGCSSKSALSAMAKSRADSFVAEILSIFASDGCANALMNACGLMSKIAAFNNVSASESDIARMWDTYIKSSPKAGNAPADYLGMSSNANYLFIYCMVYDFKRFDEQLSNIVYSHKYADDLEHVFIHPACADTMAIELKQSDALKAAQATKDSLTHLSLAKDKRLSAGAADSRDNLTAAAYQRGLAKASKADALSSSDLSLAQRKSPATNFSNTYAEATSAAGDTVSRSSSAAATKSSVGNSPTSSKPKSLSQMLLESDLDDDTELLADTKLEAMIASVVSKADGRVAQSSAAGVYAQNITPKAGNQTSSPAAKPRLSLRRNTSSKPHAAAAASTSKAATHGSANGQRKKSRFGVR